MTIIEAAIAQAGDVKNEMGWCPSEPCALDTSMGDVRLPEPVLIPARFDDGECVVRYALKSAQRVAPEQNEQQAGDRNQPPSNAAGLRWMRV